MGGRDHQKILPILQILYVTREHSAHLFRFRERLDQKQAASGITVRFLMEYYSSNILGIECRPEIFP